ncbi:transcription initiation factor-like protein iib [Amniculicola lignicola CBS 123094]|uniref:Transcription initiation factor IIB n=1 Tax=Amniculicola lignicola CBS 123094 TaxID=1392246 RepID=A0A6A5WYN7_9PLEO|nr:transcription initiation factor-like protein iib [Amniculicola lignicola CBS 123094]
MSFARDGRVLSPGEVYEEVEQPVREPEWTEDLNVTLMCPDCKEVPPNLVEEFSSGDTVCGSCGRVLADRIIDTRSEWRTFSNDDQGNDDPSRVGDAANPLLHGSQLHTEIGFGDGGLRVRELARAQNKSSHDKVNKSLQQAYSQINVLCDSSAIPKPAAESAKLLFKAADDAKLFKGKSQDVIIATCIFIACRQHDVPRSFREIFKLTNVSKKEIGRTFKTLEAFLQKQSAKDASAKAAGNGAVIGSQSFKHTKSTNASELIMRACNKLQLDMKVSIIAQEAASKVTDLGVAAGRSPLSITGACIYLIAHLMGFSRTPKDIGSAVDVSDGTIRTAYKLIYQDLDRIIEDDWIRKGGDKSKVPTA